jgi:N-acetylneuraminic acid mutarotase
MCGGSIGGIPHPTTDLCHVYDHTAARGQQWSYLPSLPAKRAGAGIVYDKISNSLIFGGGSFLINNTLRSSTTDYNDVWQLNLGNVNTGWVRKANFPYFGNHLGSVTVLKNGVERHYFLGGQLKANEPKGNLRDVFEYIPTSDTWVRRASMLFERSHFSSSTTPYKQCGIIIAGGARNGNTTSQRLTDVSYYNIETDSWIKIGDIPDARNTPICTININDGYYYCITGAVAGPWGYRRKID